MRAFMVYISYELAAMYVSITALYVGGMVVLAGALWMRGEVAGALAVLPLAVLSSIGVMWQLAHVVRASAEMRRHLYRT